MGPEKTLVGKGTTFPARSLLFWRSAVAVNGDEAVEDSDRSDRELEEECGAETSPVVLANRNCGAGEAPGCPSSADRGGETEGRAGDGKTGGASWDAGEILL